MQGERPSPFRVRRSSGSVPGRGGGSRWRWRKVKASIVEIQPTRGVANLGLRELWRYRDLAYFFAWRDVKVRYKQTLFGATWAIIQPLVLMVVFTFVFGTVLDVETPAGVPKPVFYYAGLVPWTLFATSMAACFGEPLREFESRLQDLLSASDPSPLCGGIQFGGFRRGIGSGVRA